MSPEQILKNNQKWVSERLNEDKHYFKKLSRKQNPKVLYIGCSDSRVSPEKIMEAEPGEILVYRNVANIISYMDLSIISIIHFALTHLKIKHIIVCGHYQCGGIEAALQKEEMGIPEPWLRNIRSVYDLHQQELDKIKNNTQKKKRFTELNVQEQCASILRMREVQAACEQKKVSIHGWVFDIYSGKLTDLNIKPY